MIDDDPKLTVQISYDLADELIVPLLQNQLESLLGVQEGYVLPDADAIIKAMLVVLEYNMIPDEYELYRDRIQDLAKRPHK